MYSVINQICSYNIVNPPDGAWGSPDENGTWSGLIGHALYGKSNFSMSGIAVLPEVYLNFNHFMSLHIVLTPTLLSEGRSN